MIAANVFAAVRHPEPVSQKRIGGQSRNRTGMLAKL